MSGELTAAELAQQLEAALATSSTVREASEKKAEDVKEYWQSIVPVYGDHDPKGSEPPTYDGKDRVVDAYPEDYKNSIHVESGPGYVRVGSRTKIAVFAEWGTIHIAEGAYALRTTEHFNGEVTEGKPNSVGTVDL